MQLAKNLNEQSDHRQLCAEPISTHPLQIQQRSTTQGSQGCAGTKVSASQNLSYFQINLISPLLNR